MDADQATQVLTLLEAGWPKGPWPEDTEHLWLRHLASYTFEDAKAAIELLLRRQQFTPTMAHWSEAIGEVRADARRRAAEAGGTRGSITAGQLATKQTVREELARARRSTMPLEHDHRERDEDGRPISCKLCAAHVHLDTRVAGWDRGSTVKCWELSCPACGDPHLALTRWTPEGIAVGRELSSRTVPSEQMTF